MGVLAPRLVTLDGSPHPPIDMSGMFLAHMSEKSLYIAVLWTKIDTSRVSVSIFEVPLTSNSLAYISYFPPSIAQYHQDFPQGSGMTKQYHNVFKLGLICAKLTYSFIFSVDFKIETFEFSNFHIWFVVKKNPPH